MDTPRIITEDHLLDYIFLALYQHLHVNELHLEKDILAPMQLPLTEHQIEHIRELLMNTHLVNASVGFKKAGFIYLNAAGIRVMKQYRSYSAYQKSIITEGSSPISEATEDTEVKRNESDNPTSPSAEAGYDDMAH